MNTSPINGPNIGYLQSILSSTLQNSGSANGVSALRANNDQSQLSPFAQLLSTLQQLQQSNPTQYQQVTSQISTNLQTAAQTAQTGGNTTLANTLTQLSKDFSSASTSGQLPNVQDLAQAMSGGHHHHHGHVAASGSDSDGDASNGSSINQLLSALQSNSSNANSLNPMNIIFSTLKSAGVSLNG